MINPHEVTRAFEAALCEYTGAKYAVTTTSCTQAILMALAWHTKDHPKFTRSYVGGPDPDYFPEAFERRTDYTVQPWPPMRIQLPKRTYVGVGAAVLNAGAKLEFLDVDWQGEYQLKPLPVWDSARRFTSSMFRPGAMQCVSFHAAKILADSQGGAILHDNDEADAWLRRARFDGRTEGADPKTDQVQYPSWHAYMSPDVATRLLWKLQTLPRHNADLPNDPYPDLSTMEAFK